MQGKHLDIKQILPLLQAVEKTDSGYIARCPAHDDNGQSLSISQKEGKPIQVKCNAGCSVKAIAAAIKKRQGASSNPADGNKLAVISAADLQSMDLPPVPFVVVDLLPVGLSIWASPPKFGKSWGAGLVFIRCGGA